MVDETETAEAARGLQMWRGQIRPRMRAILFSWSSLVAGVSTLAVVLSLPYLPGASVHIESAAATGFTIASIAMGACISALVLSLALPGEVRLRSWARLNDENGRSQLEYLLFTYFFAALCQLATIIVCVMATLFGSGVPLVSEVVPASHWTGLLVGFFVFFYGLSQLYVVIQTLMQTGVLIILEERLGPKI